MNGTRHIALILAAFLLASCTSPLLLTRAQEKGAKERSKVVQESLEAIHTAIDGARADGALLVIRALAPKPIDLQQQLFVGQHALAVALEMRKRQVLDLHVPDDGSHLCYWIHQPRLALAAVARSCRQLRAEVEAVEQTRARLGNLDDSVLSLQDTARQLASQLVDFETRAQELDRKLVVVADQGATHSRTLAEQEAALELLGHMSDDLNHAYRGTSDGVTETLERVHEMADFLETKAEQWEARMQSLIRTLERSVGR